MLVLTRHARQRILIGDDIMVEIVQICGDKVRVGIVAPASTAVDREEIRTKKLAASEGAADELCDE